MRQSGSLTNIQLQGGGRGGEITTNVLPIFARVHCVLEVDCTDVTALDNVIDCTACHAYFDLSTNKCSGIAT